MNGMWNSCRESGDHGVINTWDRTPYLTTVRTGEPSLIPAYNNVTRNLFISDYNSFDGIDNDDGSSYYDISHNVFYLNEGLKSDYHGHDKRYHHNINIDSYDKKYDHDDKHQHNNNDCQPASIKTTNLLTRNSFT